MNDSDNLLWPVAWMRLLGCEFGLNKHNDIAGFLAVRRPLATVRTDGHCRPRGDLVEMKPGNLVI